MNADCVPRVFAFYIGLGLGVSAMILVAFVGFAYASRLRLTSTGVPIMNLDKRHRIIRVWMGYPRPRWMHSFCYGYVANYATKAQAVAGATAWEAERLMDLH
jgi:hypothetical protein